MESVLFSTFIKIQFLETQKMLKKQIKQQFYIKKLFKDVWRFFNIFLLKKKS